MFRKITSRTGGGYTLIFDEFAVDISMDIYDSVIRVLASRCIKETTSRNLPVESNLAKFIWFEYPSYEFDKMQQRTQKLLVDLERPDLIPCTINHLKQLRFGARK